MKNFVNVQVKDQQFPVSKHSFHVLLVKELEYQTHFYLNNFFIYLTHNPNVFV